jgi:hypothetical protein
LGENDSDTLMGDVQCGDLRTLCGETPLATPATLAAPVATGTLPEPPAQLASVKLRTASTAEVYLRW